MSDAPKEENRKRKEKEEDDDEEGEITWTFLCKSSISTRPAVTPDAPCARPPGLSSSKTSWLSSAQSTGYSGGGGAKMRERVQEGMQDKKK